jgi:multidrug resistance efflux pump
LSDTTEVFRAEALEHLQQGEGEGEPLRLPNRWLGWSFQLTVAFVIATLGFVALAEVDTFSAGPAVIRAADAAELTARASGTVAAVEVAPGQAVAVNQVLVRFELADEIADQARVQQEYELQLARTLRDPSDGAARSALSSLQAERELAEARIESRQVRAPVAGVVSDIRVRSGQHVNAGEIVATLHSDSAGYRVIAILPGQDRPLLKPGMPLRLELSGYRYAYQTITIEQVGNEVVGPSAVRRFLGDDLADAVPLTGPLVLVHGTLPAGTFDDDGRQLNFFAGMQAHAEASVRRSRLSTLIFPWLKRSGAGE